VVLQQWCTHQRKLDTAWGDRCARARFFLFLVSKAADVGAVLNALATDPSSDHFLSAYHRADNQTAKISGDRVPTISQRRLSPSPPQPPASSAASSTPKPASCYRYPRVNAGGQVTMEINQEVSNATPTTTSGIDSPTIQKRTAESTVTVKSGETIILAGLIKEEKTKSTEGLPLLAQIPLIGGLFGTQSWGDNRTELILPHHPARAHRQQDAAAITGNTAAASSLERMLKSVALPPKPAVEGAK